MRIQRNVGVAAGTLLASSPPWCAGVCRRCFVSLGAGAALVGWCRGAAARLAVRSTRCGYSASRGILLAASGAMLWHARRLPCPVDPRPRARCTRLRRISARCMSWRRQLPAGRLFAFVLPA
jgi:hypothetical protein